VSAVGRSWWSFTSTIYFGRAVAIEAFRSRGSTNGLIDSSAWCLSCGSY